MSNFRRSETSIFALLFASFGLVTIFVYLLRGFGILTFIPGGVVLILIGLTVFAGIIYGIQKTKRF